MSELSNTFRFLTWGLSADHEEPKYKSQGQVQGRQWNQALASSLKDKELLQIEMNKTKVLSGTVVLPHCSYFE